MTLQLEVPDVAYRGALLEPEQRVTLGEGADAGGERLSERITIGGPVTAPVTADRAAGDDAVLRTLGEHAGDARFHMIVLGCTFEPREDERFERAWVQVRLSSGAAAPAIAWSMLPERSSRPYNLNRQVEVGAALHFVSAKVSGGKEQQIDEAFVEARNLLRSDPTWRFTRVDGHDIVDEHRLVLMVKAPQEVETTGEVRLRAILRRRKFGPVTYKVTVPEAPYQGEGDAPSSRFVLRA